MSQPKQVPPVATRPGRKIGHLVTVALAVTLAGAAVSASTVAVAAPVRITHMTFYWHGQPYTDWLNWAAQEFHKQNPGIEVNIQMAGGPSQGDYFTKLTALLAAGVPPNVIDFMDLGLDPSLFADLRPYLASTPYASADRIPPGLRPWLATSNGAIVALPWDIYPTVTYYNRDLLDELGLLDPYQLGAKWNWDSLIENSIKITTDRNGDGKPEAYGLDRMWAYIDVAIWNAGGQPYDRYMNPTRAQYSTPEAIRGLQWIQDVHNRWKVTTPTLGAEDARYALWRGNVGYSLVDGPGAMQNLFKVKFQWDVAPQPTGPARDGGGLYVDQVRVLKSAGHVAEAAEWVRFLTTNREVVERLVSMTGRVPALPGVDYMKFNPKAPAHAAAFAVQASRENIPPLFSPKMSQITKKIQPILDNVLYGNVEPKAAAQMIDEAANAILQAK